MEELFSELMSAVSEHLSSLPETFDIDAIMDSAGDALHSTLDTISDNGIEINDELKQSLLSKLGEVLGGDQSEILEHLALINDNPLDFMEIDAGPAVGEAIPEFGATTPEAETGEKKWAGQFTSGDCWDECRASTGEPGNRLTCGYHK